MSLEDAMLKQAAASEKLAAAFNRYADVVEKFGLKIEQENEGKTAAASEGKAEKTKPEPEEKKSRGRPAGSTNKPKQEPEPEKDEGDDGFGDDNDDSEGEEIKAPEDLTHEQVKKKLLEAKDACGGEKEPALAIIRKYGYDTIPSVKEKHFDQIWVDAEKLIRSKQ